MGYLNVRNVTLMAVITSCFLQAGGGMFAISVLVSTITAAPPRSFAILEGAYRYDSSAFWQTIPPITALLFVIALIANWKTNRRWHVAAGFGLFIISGLLVGIFLEPEYASITGGGFRDMVDPELQRRAQRWYMLDWGAWSLTLAAALILLAALARPVTAYKQGRTRSAD